MLTSLKSLYGMGCVVLASAVWALVFGQSVLGFLLFLAPDVLRLFLNVVLHLALVAMVVWFVWPRITHISVESVVNSRKVSWAIILLTVALIAFPGTLVMPLVYAAVSGDSSAGLLVWFSVLGLPVFKVLSVFAFFLVFKARLRTFRVGG